MKPPTNEIFQIMEAVCILNGINLLIQKIAAQSDHENDAYKAQMQFLSLIYKKNKKIADKRVTRDSHGNFIVDERDLRKDFDSN